MSKCDQNMTTEKKTKNDDLGQKRVDVFSQKSEVFHHFFGEDLRPWDLVKLPMGVSHDLRFQQITGSVATQIYFFVCTLNLGDSWNPI